MKQIAIAVTLATGLILAGCSVTEQLVRNAPPPLPKPAQQLKSEYGSIDQLDDLSMFFWPVVKDGHPITIPEWQDIVAKASTLGDDYDALSDQQFMAHQLSCNQRALMIQRQCAQLYGKDPTPQTPDDPCTADWIQDWRPDDDFKDKPDQLAGLKACQQIVSDGMASDQKQSDLADKKQKDLEQIITTIDTQEGKSNFFSGDAPNSILRMQPDGHGKIQFRIKLAFSSPNAIYDSEPRDDRGLITNIVYDGSVRKLKFTMVEIADGKKTGGRFDIDVTRIEVPDKPNLVRFVGKLTYTGPHGERRDGRVKLSGTWGTSAN